MPTIRIIESTFLLPKKNYEIAYLAACQMNQLEKLKFEDGCFFGLEKEYPEKCKNIVDIFKCLGFECKEDENGLGLAQLEANNPHAIYFLNAVAPYVKDLTYIIWQYAEYSNSYYVWAFVNGFLREIVPQFAWKKISNDDFKLINYRYYGNLKINPESFHDACKAIIDSVGGDTSLGLEELLKNLNFEVYKDHEGKIDQICYDSSNHESLINNKSIFDIYKILVTFTEKKSIYFVPECIEYRIIVVNDEIELQKPCGFDWSYSNGSNYRLPLEN